MINDHHQFFHISKYKYNSTFANASLRLYFIKVKNRSKLGARSYHHLIRNRSSVSAGIELYAIIRLPPASLQTAAAGFLAAGNPLL